MFTKKNNMTIFTATNIMNAYKLARKSRKNKQEVYLFEQNLEERLLKMLGDLKEKKYIHWKYKEIILFDSKKRYIFSPNFRDHIFHHLIYKQIYDVLDNKMVHTSFACRKWYWSHKCVKYLNKMIIKEERRLKKSSFSWLKKDKKMFSSPLRKGIIGEFENMNWKEDKGLKPSVNQLYYLKIDFSKYFFSVNHEFLKEKIRKFIQDKELLYCIDVIIDSYKSSKNYNKLLSKNRFYVEEKNKWLPIWWIISQLFANFYLNDLDQFIKHKLKVKFVRYMDDIVMLWTKDNLNYVKSEIFKFIEKDKLILNPKKISFNLVSDGITFVWYRFISRKIWVWKRIKKSFLKFWDSLQELKQKNLKLNKNDILRLQSMYYSRLWCFKITNFWDNYIKNIDNNISLFQREYPKGEGLKPL